MSVIYEMGFDLLYFFRSMVLLSTVFKFVEPPENNEKLVGKKSRVKFKIMSLKVKGDMDYVPELASIPFILRI